MAAYTPQQLEQLWISNGGNPAAAPIAAAIALAESGGNPHATNNNTNGTVDRGLWQINSVHSFQSTYDPTANVKAAIALSNNGQNWAPWTTFKNGAFRKFLNQTAAASAQQQVQGGSIQDAAGAITQPFSDAAQAIHDVWAALTNPHLWRRVLYFVGGALAIFWALKELTGSEIPALKVARA